jgi:AraC family transcriptional regulator
MVVDQKTGEVRPGLGREPVLSSARAPWEGLLLEQHAGGPIENLDVAPTGHVVSVLLARPCVVEMRNGSGPFHTVRRQLGQINIFPATAPFSARTQDTGELLAVSLEPKFLLCAAHELVNPDRLELVPQFAIEEPLLRGLLLALKTEAESGSPGGRVYAESLAVALAVHLVRHYSAEKPSVRTTPGGLARHQLRRAIEYVCDHLAEDISLKALAAAVGLSPFHFARLFKQSTGLAPHQYVIRCRIERAKGLLVGSPAPIADIALQVGFCDQSHFASHFKRIYGVSPKGFLRKVATRK